MTGFATPRLLTARQQRVVRARGHIQAARRHLVEAKLAALSADDLDDLVDEVNQADAKLDFAEKIATADYEEDE